jgi:tRNA uridine 5-carboxymethylaminomethyl modification enzyme
MAGINAHRKVHELEPVVLKRDEAYIGVLIDDLINKGTDEPYRMFTSRAEFRTLLRQDNADIRLTALGHSIGLATDERMALMVEKREKTEQIIGFLTTCTIDRDINPFLEQLGSSPLSEKTKAAKLLLRPDVYLKDLVKQVPELSQMLSDTDPLVLEQAEIRIKYEVYLEKEQELAKKMATLEDLRIPENFNYSKLTALSTEARQKLAKIKPETLGQAGRISGVNPSDVQILMVFMGR